MFGGDTGGYAASEKDLWKGGAVALCTDNARRKAVRTLAVLYRSLGARVVLCRAVAHDAAVATVSHLPYLVASALALTARQSGGLARRLAGRGLADTIRTARFDYTIQGEVIRRNGRFDEAARSFQANLDLLRTLLDASPSKARTLFTRARSASRLFRPPR